MTHTADAVVIGAGVIGASIALELAKQGRQVVVVDKAGGAGLGSTSASSAIVRFNYSTWDGVATAWEAKHCWEDWRRHLGHGGDVGGLASFRCTGMIVLDAPVAPREHVTRLFDSVGVPYEEWDAETLAARVPGIDVGRYWPPKPVDDEAFFEDPTGTLGCLYTPDAGFVDDPQLAAQNLAAAAEHHGAELLFGRAVTAVRRGERVQGVRLSGDADIDAPVVVNAAGPWSSALNRLAGVGRDFTIGVRPLRQEVHHVAAPAGYRAQAELGPAMADLDLGTYVRPATAGSLLIGGTEPECDPLDWIDDPDEVNPLVTARLFEAQVTRVARRFTDLRVPVTAKGIAGVYDVSDDWAPIYDRTELDGFYVAMGTSGNQFKNAPLVGRFLASIIAAVESGHDHDRSPVRYHCEHTGHSIDLGAFSRRRSLNAESSGTVMG